MVKVCFLLGGFQGNGGIGRVTSVLINQLCHDTEFEIHTIAYYQNDRPLLYKVNSLVKYHVLFTSLYSMTKAICLHNAIQKVNSILKKNDIDVLVACGALYYPLGILATRGTKAKCVCWEHTNPSTSKDYKFQNLARKFASIFSSHIVVLTKSAEQYYKQHFGIHNDKITQIYNPITKDVARSSSYALNSNKIITVGRLSYQKNIERLIEIANKILPLYPNWSWDIYGDGELRESLQERIEHCKLNRQLTLKGQVSDLYDRYSDYAFIVMTSRYEGFPMSLIEAAANRLPIVSFDIPTGPNEIIIDGKNGFLIDKHSDDEMIQRIIDLINNKELRESMSDEVFKLIDVFSEKRILKQWKTLFVNLK